MSLPLVLSVGCPLIAQHVDLGVDEGTFVEEVTVEVAGRLGCDHVDLVIPDGVEIGRLDGRVRPDDAASYRLDAARFDRVRTGPDGERTWRVALPELTDGDVATLVVERRWVAGVDYVWRPAGVDFAEIQVAKGLVVVGSAGLAVDGRLRWAASPGPEVELHVAHPWASRLTPPVPSLPAHGLDARAALELVSRLVLLDEAWFGSAPAVGREALGFGAADRRGVARTLVALAEGGPDHVELGRWVARPEDDPAPGAREVAVLWTTQGPRILAHPDDAGLPTEGAFRTPQGAVPAGAARVVVLRDPAAEGTTPTLSRDVRLEASGRDPLARLHPGGDLRLTVDHRLTWSTPLRAPYAVHVPLPPGSSVERPGATEGCSHLRATPDTLWILAAPGSLGCAWTVSVPVVDAWGRLPEAPGIPGPVTVAATWHDPAGSAVPGDLQLEGERWRLAAFAGHPLLATPEARDRELVERAIDASMPEPGLSAAARAGRTGWDLAGALHELLDSRVLVRPLATPADTFRPLVAARRSRVLTPGEAAVVAALYLKQAGTPQRRAARLDATWVLARPRGLGPSSGLAPAGFTEGLVRVEFHDRAAWIDLHCEACGPFEIRPELVGAEAVGPGPSRILPFEGRDGLPGGIVLRDDRWELAGPLAPYGVGVSTLTLGAPDADGLVDVSWRVAGADALALRRRLAEIPAPQRAAWLRARLGAAADAPLDLEGLAVAGAPAVLRTRGDPSLLPDALVEPLAGPVPPGAGWVALREVVRPAASGAASRIDDRPDAADACRTVVVDGTSIAQRLQRLPEAPDTTCGR